MSTDTKKKEDENLAPAWRVEITDDGLMIEGYEKGSKIKDWTCKGPDELPEKPVDLQGMFAALGIMQEPDADGSTVWVDGVGNRIGNIVYWLSEGALSS